MSILFYNRGIMHHRLENISVFVETVEAGGWRLLSRGRASGLVALRCRKGSRTIGGAA